MGLTRATLVGAGLWGWALLAWGQQGPGIYTCVDAKGRRLTADRPIPECTDREQRELSGSGVVRRTVPPSYTAAEQAQREEAARKATEEANRLAEEKRRDRALLARYPNQAIHDKERSTAIQVVDDLILSASKRAQDLAQQRRSLQTEVEGFKGDESKVPVRLKRLIEENEAQQAAQKRFLTEQAAEKQRINARFDEELARLKTMWAQQATPAGAASGRRS